MEQLNQDLKTGQFKQFYLLYGQEAYLRRLYLGRLKKALLPQGEEMNYAHFEGKNPPLEEILELAETLPFFADRRLLILEDTGLFKGGPGELAEALAHFPSTTFLIFTEQEVDRRSRLYKAVSSLGRAVELNTQDPSTLQKWILGQVKREGRQITREALGSLLEKTGTDMDNISQELEKLFSYTLGRPEIRPEDVEAVCVSHTENRIFDMVRATARGDARKALGLYYDLLSLKEPPLRILFLLTREFRQLLAVKELDRQGYSQKEIAAKTGTQSFVAGRLREQARAFSRERLTRILEEAALLETDTKTGRITDRLAVEVFLLSVGEGIPLSNRCSTHTSFPV